MRPHSVECGKKDVFDIRASAGFASMRPHSVECGKGLVSIVRDGQLPASMRPHSVECGKVAERERLRNTIPLQ